MRGRKKTNETRQAIVRCAAEIFSQREFHKVLTDDIARRVGIGKGTIYRYFRSKEALYLAAVAEGLEGMHAAVAAVVQRDAPLETTIRDLVRTMINYFWRQRDFFVLMQRLEPKLKARERADWRTRRNEMVGMVRRLIDQVVKQADCAPLNARLAVEILFGMIRSACLYRSESDRPEELARLISDIFLHGLAGNGGARTDEPQKLAVVQGGTRRL